MDKKIPLKIKRLSKDYSDVKMPEYQTEGSSGMDIRAAVPDKLILKAGSFAMVPTNISVQIPDGYEVQVRARSGLAAKHGIGVLNGPGTIDADYRGEIKIILFNFSDSDFKIERGERIAQLVISAVIKAELIEQEDLDKSTRGEGGFGHTGKS